MPLPNSHSNKFEYDTSLEFRESMVSLHSLQLEFNKIVEQNAKLKTEVDHLMMHNESLKFELKKSADSIIRYLQVNEFQRQALTDQQKFIDELNKKLQEKIYWINSHL